MLLVMKAALREAEMPKMRWWRESEIPRMNAMLDAVLCALLCLKIEMLSRGRG